MFSIFCSAKEGRKGLFLFLSIYPFPALRRAVHFTSQVGGGGGAIRRSSKTFFSQKEKRKVLYEL